MVLLARLLREPLLHFVVAGGVLFAAFSIARGPEPRAEDATTIVVDRRTLLTFMQYRANAFEPETFGAALDALPEDELAALVEAYAEEEALYREAKALGLETSDYVIRRRLVDKLKFLLGDVTADAAIDESALAEYFQAHRESYVVEPSVTFTHVFFDAEQRGAERARAAAAAARAALNSAASGFNDAAGLGDRFPFLKNYVDRTFDYVASHFGTEFANELAGVPAAATEWQGPLRSAYGEHVVLVTRRAELRDPELAEVRTDVERDFMGARADAALAELGRAVRERYRVEIGELRGEARGEARGENHGGSAAQ